MSGLYGLITLEEPIQCYSCHLDDEILDLKEQKKVSDLWFEEGLFNIVLQNFIESHDSRHADGDNSHRIEFIVDLLSELSYQLAFDWNALSEWLKQREILRYHRVVHGVKEPEFLADLGRYYKNYIAGNS